MRVIFAGLFVFRGLMGFSLLLGVLGVFESGAPPAVVGLGGSIVIFALCAIALWLFNPKGANRFGTKTPDQFVRELDEAGLLVSTDFQATRAFGVEEFEDEGSHYFVELTDGRVLFLSGQYLYDYEPIDLDARPPRRFPCTHFTVRRG